MIPAYSEKIEVPETKSDPNVLLPQQVQQLHEQVLGLRQTVEYLQRENARLKSDIQTLASAINRK